MQTTATTSKGTYIINTDGVHATFREDFGHKDVDGLCPGIHTVELDDEGHLKGTVKTADKIEIKGEVYGTAIHTKVNFVIEDLVDPEMGGFGAMFTGYKGMGKTMLAELICNRCIEEFFMPVINIKKMVRSKDLEKIIRATGDCVVFIDEYSKHYSPRWRNTTGGNDNLDFSDELLQLMSDKTLGKVIWLITDNEEKNISEYIINRSGRMRYRFRFEYVEDDVVLDICKRYGVNEQITEFLRDHAKASKENIDNILTLADKARKYTKLSEFQGVFKYLNVKPPMFKEYFIKTDNPKAIAASIEGDNITFCIKHDNDITTESGEVINKGENFATYSIADMWRNRRGTIFGVNYLLCSRDIENKPENKYNLNIAACPADEFKERGFWF